MIIKIINKANKMYLDIRRRSFEELSKNIECKKINDLMLEVPISNHLFEALDIYTKIYLSKSINVNHLILDENDLIKALIKNPNKLLNMTPNGMIVPKRELALDFNNLVKSYVKILESVNIYNFIEKFHFPPNIRLKYNQAKDENLKRSHPTEMMHSDTWTGANFNWIASHIYILGDVANNNISYGYPPETFEENWLFPIKSASLGKIYSDQFKMINYTPKKGSFILADASIFHKSNANPNGGIRASLDTGFDLIAPNIKKYNIRSVEEKNVASFRDNETVSKEDFWSIGSETFFSFPNRFEEQVDSQGGFKHPSSTQNIKIV